MRNAGQLTSVKYKQEAGKPEFSPLVRMIRSVGQDGHVEMAGDRRRIPRTRRINLRQNRATSEEAEFLLHQRVELNALTSDQLVAFIEQETSTAWCQEDRARE